MRSSNALVSLAALVTVASAANGAEPCRNEAVSAEAEAPAIRFMQLLQSGKGAQAVGDVIDQSKLWSARPGIKEQMVGQVDAATRAYGPVVKFERVCSEKIGGMVVRQFYIAQHGEMVTRWEFDLIQGNVGWRLGYFGFTDQVQSWF